MLNTRSFYPRSTILNPVIDIWVLSNEAQIISSGCQAAFELLLEFILLRRSKNVIRFSIAGKLFSTASTVLNFLNNLSNSTSVNILQWEITEALPNTVKASAYKKLVLVRITVCIAIQQYSKNASCIFNNDEDIYYKTLDFTKRPYARHWVFSYSAAPRRKANSWLLWFFNYCRDPNFHKNGLLV